MTTATPKPPKNKSEEAALEKALAEYKLSRIDAARDFLTGEKVTAVREALADLLEAGLPSGSAALGNLQQLPGFLDRAVAGLDADVQALQAVINPPEVVTAEPGAPLPGPAPIPLV